jgi:hypothetical protein
MQLVEQCAIRLSGDVTGLDADKNPSDLSIAGVFYWAEGSNRLRRVSARMFRHLALE